MVKYYLSVKQGEYEKDGQKKGRYRNIGELHESKNGNMFILLYTMPGHFINLFPAENKFEQPIQLGESSQYESDGIPF